MGIISIKKGVNKINDLSFLEFSKELMGYDVVNRQNGFKIARFILFWNGFTLAQIKKKYDLVQRTANYEY